VSPPDLVPRVIVLLATYDGLRWLGEQVDSILSQRGVTLEVVVSDDMSSDGTWEWLQDRAATEPRLTLLPRQRAGGAAANFFRLLREVDLSGDPLVALADQDDVWLPGKLASQVAQLARDGADGVSSNVTAFDAAGTRALLRKDFPQRRFDYLFEGPGPGCTFVLSSRLVAQLQALLRTRAGVASGIDFHDWLIYGVCRARGWRWSIAGEPTVDYRQHETNAFGANLTVRSAVHRLGLVRRKWHRREAVAMAEVALQVAPADRRAELARLIGLLSDDGVRARLQLVGMAPQLRRRPRDRAAIGMLMLLGIW